jgi:peroxisomal 3,2-trans-enoyl-CoA isomerase
MQDEAQKQYIDLINKLAGAEAAASSGDSASSGGDDRYTGMKVTKQNKVFRIQLNRPNKKNALTWQV